MEYMTTAEISNVWGISARRVAILCKQNRIQGVVMKGKTWLIPSNSMKPDDSRKKSILKK